MRIETERLILREWTEQDLPPFAEINRDKEVMEYFPKTLSYEETAAFYHRILREWEECGFGLYAAELKTTGEFIGYIGFHRFDFEAPFSPGVEIGWRLARKHWNQGYATEAAKACLDDAAKENSSAGYTPLRPCATAGQNASCKKPAWSRRAPSRTRHCPTGIGSKNTSYTTSNYN